LVFCRYSRLPLGPGLCSCLFRCIFKALLLLHRQSPRRFVPCACAPPPWRLHRTTPPLEKYSPGVLSANSSSATSRFTLRLLTEGVDPRLRGDAVADLNRSKRSMRFPIHVCALQPAMSAHTVPNSGAVNIFGLRALTCCWRASISVLTRLRSMWR